MFTEIGHPFSRGEKMYDVTFENVQAGLRTDYLFRLANQHGGIVLGTGDRSLRPSSHLGVPRCPVSACRLAAVACTGRSNETYITGSIRSELPNERDGQAERGDTDSVGATRAWVPQI